MRPRLIWIVLAALAACTNPPPVPPVGSPAPTRTTLEPSEEPTLARPPVFRPGSCRPSLVTRRPIVAAAKDGIVLLRPTDGMRLCVLVSITDPGDASVSLAITPDGKTLYFSFGGIMRCYGLYSIPTRGGEIKPVSQDGYSPDVSPDGKRLAYDASMACENRDHRMIVRDITSGNETEWIGKGEGGYCCPRWAPDARFLIVFEAGADSARSFLLDTRKEGALAGKAWPPINNDISLSGGYTLRSAGTSLTGAVHNPRTDAILFGVFYSEGFEGERHPILEFSPQSGRFREFFSGDGFPLAFDPSGTQLLYVRPNSGGRLYRLTGGRSTFLGAGYRTAVW